MDDASINQEFSIVGDMIIYYQWLFDVSILLVSPFALAATPRALALQLASLFAD